MFATLAALTIHLAAMSFENVNEEPVLVTVEAHTFGSKETGYLKTRTVCRELGDACVRGLDVELEAE